MKILVLNTNILAISPVDSGDAWITEDQIIPKHVAEGAKVISVTKLPQDYSPGKYTYDGKFIPVPEKVVPRNAAEILKDISDLEGKQNRAVREALLGIEGAIERLQNIENDIANLRSQLS